MQHRRAALAAFVLSVSLAIPVWAESFFGPKTFTAAAGKPQTFTETIAVDSGAACEGKAVFTLLVQNDGVASAVVTLNGVAVLTESDFPRVPAEVPVRLGASNVLGVQLNGGTAGGTLTLAIRRDIETPLASPVTHTLTGKSGTFTTTANVSDTSGPFILEVVSGGATGSIRINGAVVVTDNELTKTATLLRKSVTLQAANTIVTELKGTAGELVTIALRRRVDASACSGIIVNFTAPAALAMVNAHTIVVTGTTTGTREVGVTVNSFPADIDLEHAGTAADPFRWAANVSAEPGTVTLTAVASSGGARGTALRTVGFAPDANSLTFAAQPRGGLVPLTTGFLLDGDLAGITRYDADLDGDGAYETSSATLPALARTYTTPGIRIATVRITRADGRTQVASAIVNPQSVATLDGLFQSLWQRFTSALAARDVEGALAQMLDAFTREKYRRGLTRIQPLLPSYAASVRSFRPKELEADYAHYLLIRAHSDGQEFGYHVYFQRDEHGVWKLVQF